MHTRRLVALLAALVMTMLLMISSATAESLLDVVVRSAPLTRSDTVKDGMVRVWLSSMGTIDSLDVTVTGSYSVNGNTAMSLSNGESVSVSFDSSTGKMTMTMNGLTYSVGQELRLRRHQANGTSAVSIAQAKRPSNLYPGDLQLIAQQNGDSYRLYAIVHVYLEYYLYGVVPYEMSSGWPIEALKAQAVAARTYTVRRLNTRSAYLYDLTDTASDQVYYGHTGSVSNATKAVDETKGIVIMNDGSLSGTYYTASNGGQTEAVKNAWGGSGYPYLGVKNDPFDAANTSSVRRRLTVYSDFDHTSQNTTLGQLLTEAAQSQLGEGAVIQTIDSVTPHTPKYPSPSRLYTKLDFGVTALVNGVSQKAVLSFSIFDELETPLGMNINSSTKNELWSAEAVEDGFRITVGRWGHGIGMSQRGAQQMSQMGYTYDQILGFYYEGCERIQYTFTHTILSAGSSSEVVATEPPATISPAAQDQATLSLVGVTDIAPLRYTASDSGTILIGVPNGASVTVLKKADTWTLVKYGEINGYLPTASLIFTGTPPTSTTETATIITLWGTVTGTNALNFREGPGYNYNIMTELTEGTVLCILNATGEWVKVQWGSKVGYVSPDYLTFHDAYPSETGGDDSAMVSLESDSATAALLATPSTTATVIMQIAHGTQVTVLSDDGTWCQVKVAGMTGYLLRSQLDFDATGSTPTDVPGLKATVNTDSSTLNLRSGPSTNDDIITEIPKGTTVIVTSYGEEWCAVTWGEYSGYVMTAYLLFDTEDTTPPEDTEEPTASPSPSPTEVTAWVMGTVNYVNLRETASTEGKVITTIPSGDELAVLEKGSTFTHVRHGSATGYVLSQHLTYTEPLPSIGVRYINTQSDPLALRDEPTTTGSTVLVYIPRATPVMLLEDLGSWCHVQYGSYVGYCSAAYLSSKKPSDNTVDDTRVYDPTLTTVTGLTALVNPASQEVIKLYQWCSLEAPEMSTADVGVTVMVNKKGDIWCQITYEGETGYCLTNDLSFILPTE